MCSLSRGEVESNPIPLSWSLPLTAPHHTCLVYLYAPTQPLYLVSCTHHTCISRLPSHSGASRKKDAHPSQPLHQPPKGQDQPPLPTGRPLRPPKDDQVPTCSGRTIPTSRRLRTTMNTSTRSGGTLACCFDSPTRTLLRYSLYAMMIGLSLHTH